MVPHAVAFAAIFFDPPINLLVFQLLWIGTQVFAFILMFTFIILHCLGARAWLVILWLFPLLIATSVIIYLFSLGISLY